MTYPAKSHPKFHRRRTNLIHRQRLGRSPTLETLERRTLFALTVEPFSAAGDPLDLANELLLPDTGVTIVGASFVGSDGQAGTYAGFDLTSRNNRVAISDGVLLTSGAANNALGPNQNNPDQQGAQDDASAELNQPGDADLTTLLLSGTNDANSLTVQFTVAPGINSVLFDFVFGSEEFADFVGGINDGFGAYLDGTQICFDTDGNPVTVNNNFFQFNNAGVTAAQDDDVQGKIGVNFDIEYDGLTQLIRTTAPIDPNITTHTLKFAIADAADDLLDSGVFISRLQGSEVVVSGPTTDLPIPGVFNFEPAVISQSELGAFVTLKVVRSNGASGLVTVDVVTADDTATAGLDYTAFPLTTLTFADQELSKTITIPIIDDLIAEGDETFRAILANPTNAAGLGLNSVANITLVDNELGVQFVQPVFSVKEGTEIVQLTITVVTTSPPPTTLTVDFATTAGGSAIAGVDYTPVSGTLTFAPTVTAQTFTIDILDDYLIEPTETINLTLSNVNAPYILAPRNPAVVEIADLVRPPAILDMAFVTNERLINGIAVRYSEQMTEENVEDPKNYDIFVRKETKKLGGSATRTRVNISSVVYEPTSRTATLTTSRPLSDNKVYEVVINTLRFDGVESINGVKLDGNYDNNPDPNPTDDNDVEDDPNDFADDFTGYLTRSRTKSTYFDENGDRITLQLQGDGIMEYFRSVERKVRVLRLIETSQDTILTGSFSPAKRTDGLARIRTFLTGTGVRNRLPQPPFTIIETFPGLQEPNT